MFRKMMRQPLSPQDEAWLTAETARLPTLDGRPVEYEVDTVGPDLKHPGVKLTVRAQSPDHARSYGTLIMKECFEERGLTCAEPEVHKMENGFMCIWTWPDLSEAEWERRLNQVARGNSLKQCFGQIPGWNRGVVALTYAIPLL